MRSEGKLGNKPKMVTVSLVSPSTGKVSPVGLMAPPSMRDHSPMMDVHPMMLFRMQALFCFC